MAAYYKTIQGKQYDRALLENADAAVAGRGDGRISLDDAVSIFAQLQDSNSYTEVEKRTVSYIRTHYKFTPEADAWLRKQVRSWAASRGRSKSVATGKRKKVAPVSPVPSQERAKEEPPAIPVKDENTIAKKSSIPWLWVGLGLLFILVLVVVYFWKSGQIAPVSQPVSRVKEEAKETPSKVTSMPARIVVLFVQNSAGVSVPDKKNLSEFAKVWKTQPVQRKIEIQGYSCDLGTKSINRKIRLARAKAVQAHLAAQGIAVDKIEIASPEKLDFLYPNGSEQNRRKNRIAVVRLAE